MSNSSISINTNDANAAKKANNLSDLASASTARTNLGLGTMATKNYAALDVAVNETKGADIASATTTDIGAATGNYVNVTGTTTITGLGTVQAGTRRIVNFTGALTLVHNATSLILPTAANITTAAGDTATFVSLGSGNWKCVSYDRASGAALASSGGMSQQASVYRSSTQSMSAGSWTKVQFNTEDYDTGSNYDNATNYRYTAPSSGYYRVTSTVSIYTDATNTGMIAIYKNGSTYKLVVFTPGTGNDASFSINALMSLSTSDYIEIYVVGRGTPNINGGSSPRVSWLEVAKVGLIFILCPPTNKQNITIEWFEETI